MKISWRNRFKLGMSGSLWVVHLLPTDSFPLIYVYIQTPQPTHPWFVHTSSHVKLSPGKRNMCSYVFGTIGQKFWGMSRRECGLQMSTQTPGPVWRGLCCPGLKTILSLFLKSDLPPLFSTNINFWFDSYIILDFPLNIVGNRCFL